MITQINQVNGESTLEFAYLAPRCLVGLVQRHYATWKNEDNCRDALTSFLQKGLTSNRNTTIRQCILGKQRIAVEQLGKLADAFNGSDFFLEYEKPKILALANILNQRRQEIGYTLMEISEKVKEPRVSVMAKIMKGESVPTYTDIIKLSRLLDLSSNDIDYRWGPAFDEDLFDWEIPFTEYYDNCLSNLFATNLNQDKSKCAIDVIGGQAINGTDKVYHDDFGTYLPHENCGMVILNIRPTDIYHYAGEIGLFDTQADFWFEKISRNQFVFAWGENFRHCLPPEKIVNQHNWEEWINKVTSGYYQDVIPTSRIDLTIEPNEREIIVLTKKEYSKLVEEVDKLESQNFALDVENKKITGEKERLDENLEIIKKGMEKRRRKNKKHRRKFIAKVEKNLFEDEDVSDI